MNLATTESLNILGNGFEFQYGAPLETPVAFRILMQDLPVPTLALTF